MDDDETLHWSREWKALAVGTGGFLLLYLLPGDSARLHGALVESVELARWYAREHVISCLLPAFLIAGAVGVFVRQGAVLRYLGADAPKPAAYAVASVSGTLLAVCSCTILPLFASIHRRGAGLGPATAFLYSGPAINVLAIVLTATVLGPELGMARALGAIVFGVVVGLAMHAIFRGDEREASRGALSTGDAPSERPAWVTAIHLGTMVAILVFANWGPSTAPSGPWHWTHAHRWMLTSVLGLALAAELVRWFGLALWKVACIAVATAITALAPPAHPDLAFAVAIVGLSLAIARDEGELGAWFASSWGFAKQILPLLLVGVLLAGLLLGRPDHEGLIPSVWIASAVGGNGIGANVFAALSGALMYFATLTEVPILQGLLGAGMGRGPALALLLAGPALSLPSMLVIAGVLGWRKTGVYVSLVVVMATISGMAFGAYVGT